jgi:hypothetical protein
MAGLARKTMEQELYKLLYTFGSFLPAMTSPISRSLAETSWSVNNKGTGYFQLFVEHAMD